MGKKFDTGWSRTLILLLIFNKHIIPALPVRQAFAISNV